MNAALEIDKNDLVANFCDAYFALKQKNSKISKNSGHALKETVMLKNNWLNKNVFITGCTGLLGSWLTEELINLNANIIGLVRDHVPRSRIYREGLIDKINIVSGNLEEHSVIDRALNEYEVEVVFHLGAQSIVPIANNNPISTFESNIKGTWVLLEACRRNKQVKKIIVASSDKAYGEHKISAL